MEEYTIPHDHTPIEDTFCNWITERWNIGMKINSYSYWSAMAGHMHCCSMAVWEMNRTQCREYLALSSLAHALAKTARLEE